MNSVAASERLSWLPLASAVSLYVGTMGVLLVLGLRATAGTFVYAQDDPYIHLSLARTLAEHGVWGIRPDEFAAASSSPLWTVIVAACWKLGLRQAWWPLALNVACGLGVLTTIDRVLLAGVRNTERALTLSAVVLVTPLPTLALIGMEHSLQTLLVAAFVWSVASTIGRDDNGRVWIVYTLGALLTATRYEGLFVVAAGAIGLVQRRRHGVAILLCVAAAVPVAVSGVYLLSHGAAFLPNSVLMKSQPSRFGSVGSGIAAVLSDWIAVVSLFSRPSERPSLTLGVLGVLALTSSGAGGAWNRSRSFAGLFVMTALLHAALVKLEWFFRYEAYLVSLGIAALCLMLAERQPRELALFPIRRNLAGTVVLILLALPLGVRTLSALAMTPAAMRNVYEQQYQMGLFFRDAYRGEPIAVNDIGAVGWLSSSPMLDVYGLATQEVADLKRRQAWSPEALQALVARRGVRAVAMYEKAFSSLIPHSWTLVGEWQIENSVGVSEDTVGFFAPTPGDALRLRAALDLYEPRLPRTVVYRALNP